MKNLAIVLIVVFWLSCLAVGAALAQKLSPRTTCQDNLCVTTYFSPFGFTSVVERTDGQPLLNLETQCEFNAGHTKITCIHPVTILP